MASFARVEHPSQQYVMARERAEVGFQHLAFTADLVGRFAARATAAVKTGFARWMEAHRRAVQDRVMWELALSDRRVMEEIRAIRDHAAAQDAAI